MPHFSLPLREVGFSAPAKLRITHRERGSNSTPRSRKSGETWGTRPILPAYLAEMEFRFNRQKRHDLFIDTLRHMVTADPLTFERLAA